MSPKKAQIVLVIINLLAIPAVGYAIHAFFAVKSAIANSEPQIPFDSGIFYLFLASIFWIFSIIQYVGMRGGKAHVPKFATPLAIGWFIGMLVIANLLPYFVKQSFEKSGYVKCKDPREISRVSRGESSIYKKGSCESHEMDTYNLDQTKIISVESVDENTIKVLFNPMLETLYYCPGVNVSEKDNSINISFVRCPINKKCPVSLQAQQSENGNYYVLVKNNGKSVVVQSTTEEKKIYPQ